ncbi:phosphoribosylanthranilate isomerase [Candidatus Vidania fulgoroideorum]
MLKLCGFKKNADINKCIFLKILNLGLVFYEKSFRLINFKKIKKAKTVVFFGVYVNTNFNFILKNNLTINQLHGNNNYNLYNKKTIIKTFFFSINNYFNFVNIFIINCFKPNYIIIDKLNNFYGGLGKGFSKDYLNKINKKTIISGGININNIKKINKSFFYGLDISSGIEYKKKKKYSLIKKILKNV